MTFQPTNKGYDATVARRPDPDGENGWLTSLLADHTEKKLWVADISSDFGMSGSTGQSFRTRSYFPHNMQQLSYTVTCQFPNQEWYADTIEFIRSMQVQFTSSLRLQIVSRVAYTGTKRRLKGPHLDMMIEGYVDTIQRRHIQHEYAPELKFSFIAERVLYPLDWRDQGVTITMNKTWKQIIEDKMPGFAPVPDPPAPTEPARSPTVPTELIPGLNISSQLAS